MRSETITDKVREFHEAFGHPSDRKPNLGKAEDAKEDLEEIAEALDFMAVNLKDLAAKRGKNEALLRLQLIVEEVGELASALADEDMVEVLDALTDIDVVVAGAWLTFGLDKVQDVAQEEVHRSNMSKLGSDGKPVLHDSGRILKGPNYVRPDLERFLGILLSEEEE